MIDLNKEAKNLADNESLFRDGLLTLCNKKLFIKGAIARANSKYVKQQILLAKIDALRNIAGDDDEHTEKRRVLHITRFQQELKQLQDE